MKVNKAGEERRIATFFDASSLGQVREFKYMGQIMTDDGKCENDIKRRIAIARSCFICMTSDDMETKMGYKNKASAMLCFINRIICIRDPGD